MEYSYVAGTINETQHTMHGYDDDDGGLKYNYFLFIHLCMAIAVCVCVLCGNRNQSISHWISEYGIFHAN